MKEGKKAEDAAVAKWKKDWGYNSEDCDETFLRISATSFRQGFRAALEAPVPELNGSFPLVLYFPTKEDKDSFIKVAQQAMPGLVAKDL